MSIEATNKTRMIWKVFFAVFLFLITYTIVFKSLSIGSSDYYNHMNVVENIHLSGFWDCFLNNPYMMWHLLVKSFGKIFSVPIQYSTAIVTGLINSVTYLIVERIFNDSGIKSYTGLVSFIVCVAGPIYIPWYNQNIYLGQGTPNVWHNPTWIIARPFMIVCICLVLKMLRQIELKEKITIKQYIILSCLLLLSVFAKPSFLQGFIPALGIYILVKCIIERFKNFLPYLFLCLTFVPGVLLMGYQSFVFFFSDSTASSGGIGIGWLEANKYSPNVWISMLLVFLFPLLYLILNVKKVYKKPDIQLIFSFLVCSWWEALFLYENGSRKFHGNFGWASLLANFAIWMVTLLYFVRDFQTMETGSKLERIKNYALMIVLALHVVCGVYYVYLLAYVPGYWL